MSLNSNNEELTEILNQVKNLPSQGQGGAVNSVNGKTGDVILTADDIEGVLSETELESALESVLKIDQNPTQDSQNLVTSGGVYADLENINNSMPKIFTVTATMYGAPNFTVTGLSPSKYDDILEAHNNGYIVQLKSTTGLYNFDLVSTAQGRLTFQQTTFYNNKYRIIYVQIDSNSEIKVLELTVPETTVETVNGKVGPNIVLTANDIDALPKQDFEDFEIDYKTFETRIKSELNLKQDVLESYVKTINGNDGDVTISIPEKVSELENDKYYATETFVTNKIAEAELAGGDVDLSGYATKEDIADKITMADMTTYIAENMSDWADIKNKPGDVITEEGFVDLAKTVILDMSTEADSMFSFETDAQGVELNVGDKLFACISVNTPTESSYMESEVVDAEGSMLAVFNSSQNPFEIIDSMQFIKNDAALPAFIVVYEKDEDSDNAYIIVLTDADYTGYNFTAAIKGTISKFIKLTNDALDLDENPAQYSQKPISSGGAFEAIKNLRESTAEEIKNIRESTASVFVVTTRIELASQLIVFNDLSPHAFQDIKTAHESGKLVYLKSTSGFYIATLVLMSPTVALFALEFESIIPGNFNTAFIKIDNNNELTYTVVSENNEVTSVNGKKGAVTLSAEDVGALPDDTEIPVVPENISAFNNDAGYLTKHQSLEEYEKKVETDNKIAAHNVDNSAHQDIRLLINGLVNRLNAIADSDDTTLDQLSEIVAYIKSNKNLIDAITTEKISYADIVTNLTTNVANKPLSASMGVALKAAIDAIIIPTKTSQLTNDSGFATEASVDTKLGTKQDKLTEYVETVNGKSGKVMLSASDVGAPLKSDFESHVSNYNDYVASTNAMIGDINTILDNINGAVI